MGISTNGKHVIVGILFLLMLLLAYYFHATAMLEHQPWPITDARIERESNPENRAFLVKERAKQAAELESTKERLEYGAVFALGCASLLGFWFLRLRVRT